MALNSSSLSRTANTKFQVFKSASLEPIVNYVSPEEKALTDCKGYCIDSSYSFINSFEGLIDPTASMNHETFLWGRAGITVNSMLQLEVTATKRRD